MQTTVPPVRSLDEIKTQAKELWEAVHRHALHNHWPIVSYQGASGYEGEFIMRGLCEKVWPQYAGVAKRGELDAFVSPIYKYLRNTGNAACTFNPALNRAPGQATGPRELPTWFVSQKWNNGSPSTTSVFPSPRGGTTETPSTQTVPVNLAQSIGSSVAPSVFQTIKDAITGKDKDKDKHATVKAARAAASSIADYVEIVLLESDFPLTVDEILFALRSENVQVSDWTLRLDLSDLIEAGHISVRQETDDERVLRNGSTAGRYAQLYWHGEDVPTRTVGKLFSDFAQAASTPGKTPMHLRAHTPGSSWVWEADPRMEKVLELIDEMVEERTASMAQELQAARAELEELRPLRQKLRDLLG